MPVRIEMAALVDFTEALLRDSTNTNWTADEVQTQLDLYRLNVSGLLLGRDITKKIFTPDTVAFYDGPKFFANDAALNSAQDQTGTVVTPDSKDYFNSRFAFTAVQTYSQLYLFGSAFNPYLAAADLLDRHPDAQDASQIKSLSVMQYRIEYAREGSLSDRYRQIGAFINRRRDVGFQQRTPDPYNRITP